jgi:hypothetical protein
MAPFGVQAERNSAIFSNRQNPSYRIVPPPNALKVINV